jgi:hypothetical protein
MCRVVFKGLVRKLDRCAAWCSKTRYVMPLLLSLATVAGKTDAQENPSSTLLKIGVTHSEVLPELPPNQQVGQVFDGFDVQAAQNAKAPQAVPQAKQPVQQSVKPTPPPNQMIRVPGAWPANFKGMKAAPLATTTKSMQPRIAPGYSKPAAQSRPTKAEIAAAIQAFASQRNPRGVPPPSAMQQSQLHAGIGTSGYGRSTNRLNGSASSAQSNSSVQKNGGSTISPNEIRFKIPAWMAGVWQRSDSNELSRVSLPSGKQLKAAGHNVAGVRDAFGTYRDETGQIWQVFDPRKVTGSIDRGTAIDFSTVTSYNIITGGSDAPIVAVRATHVIVSKSTHRVVSSYQDEELNTYSKTLDGRLRTESSVKVFDAKGKPKLLTTALSMEVQIAPFTGPVRKTTK